MNLYRMARERAAAGRPVKVGLIGAGKFGAMFLNQVPSMPGVEVTMVADLDPERARVTCQKL
ncbi:MAG: flagellar biosynthesis protein FlgA, partial [Acetobacteraceae bacterium]|nr:flagellar biosynthesis protein FlgA [Acetobacteraceae bacterium]